MKTKADVLEALKSVGFVERTAELAQKFRRDPQAKEKRIRKDKVFEIISKHGLTSKLYNKAYHIYGLGNDNGREKIIFWFYHSWILFSFTYFDNGDFVYNGRWWEIKSEIMNDEDYRSGSPAFSSYEDIEEIVSTAIKIYKDSLNALYGIH